MGLLKVIAPDLGIDLGTSHTRIYKEAQGLVLDEPSLLVMDTKSHDIVAIGDRAKDMEDKTPERLNSISPLVNGAISDFDLTREMLEYFVKKSNPRPSLFQPRVLISVPSGITDVERRAVEDVALHSGVRDVYLIEESLASAIGAGASPEDSRGVMTVNLGAGISEAVVSSMGGVVSSTTLHHGGRELDRQIVDRIKENMDVLVGRRTARNIKENMASIKVSDQDKYMEVTGRDYITGLPKDLKVESKQLTNIFVKYAEEVTEIIVETLEKTPPEFASDIKEYSIFLSGGSSRIEGLDQYIRESLDIDVYLVEDPFHSTINGIGYMVENLDNYIDLLRPL